MGYDRPVNAQLRTLVGAAMVLGSVLAACSPSEPTGPVQPVASAPAPSVSTPVAPSPPPSASALPPSSPSPMPSAGDPSSEPGPTVDPGAAYAPLDGVLAAASVRGRLPVAVMVDDNVQARPQYGFNSASIVYQAPADGGETRYMMVFQEGNAKRIEPVRSGRPYFVNWASEYRSAYAHYGGDLKTLAYIPKIHGKFLFNVDALYFSGSAFHRDKSRKAPHNGVTSSTAVRTKAVKRGAPSTMVPGLGVRPFADDLPAAQRPTKGSISIPYNRGGTSYTYDRARNLYLRSVKGKAQVDAVDRKRVTARNVVVLWMRLSVDPESEPHHNRPQLDHVGTGKAIVFRDGKAIKGTWKKPSRHALTRFYDGSGTEIPLVRGRIFIQVVRTGTKVAYDAAE